MGAGRLPALTQAQVTEFLDWASKGRSMAAMARRYGVTCKVLYKTLRREHKRPYRREAKNDGRERRA
jgi:DNA-binding phage protein